MDATVRILIGDVLTRLREMPDESVHCCVTSPPYFGLRDYGCEGQIGLEPTPATYVAALGEVFAEVCRVLRKDGTLWLNMGDSYARDARKGQHRPGDSGKQAYIYDHGGGRASATANLDAIGRKPKDLIGIPWRVAFALQDAGWYLRSDIIWAKNNPMPESVADRPTRSHEYLFLLAKSERYYYDAFAIREKGIYPAGTVGAKGSVERAAENGVNGRPPEYKVYDGYRNKRSVWTINTAPFAGAHFATFPPALVEPCILAGTSEQGCCPECGAPWTRVPVTEMRTTGWAPVCKHAGEPIPCTVLDPFAGSGTVGAVAQAHGRSAILIELQPAYEKLIRQRLDKVQLRLPNS